MFDQAAGHQSLGRLAYTINHHLEHHRQIDTIPGIKQDRRTPHYSGRGEGTHVEASKGPLDTSHTHTHRRLTRRS